MLLINHVPTAFSSKAKAQAIAAANSKDDPDWTYLVVALGKGKYYEVAVYDEENNFLGYL